MLINQETCIKCKICIPYCPVDAIVYNKEAHTVDIDYDQCVECGVCKYSEVCPTDSFVQQEMEFPRILRSQFSNPLIPHPGTGVPGRGTEEMKTNDVTGRFKKGMAGVAIEMGRPGTGTRLYDVEKVAMALAPLGVHFEPHNPVTPLMTDQSTGKMREDVLNEKALSAIIEFDVPQNKLAEVFAALKEVTPKIDTVYSLDLACRLEDGFNPVLEVANASGFAVSINGKTNVGLGRPLAKEEK